MKEEEKSGLPLSNDGVNSRPLTLSESLVIHASLLGGLFLASEIMGPTSDQLPGREALIAVDYYIPIQILKRSLCAMSPLGCLSQLRFTTKRLVYYKYAS